MTRDEYRAYLRTDAWRAKRQAALLAADYQCQRCGCELGAGPPLDVHHTTYANVGNEQPDDLIVLCRVCHDEQHARQAARVYRRKAIEQAELLGGEDRE